MDARSRTARRAAREQGVPVSLMRFGMSSTIDDVTLDALGPSEPFFADGANDVNENSIVLRVTYRCPSCARPFRILFTGDAAARAEARLLDRGVDLAAEVLLCTFICATQHKRS